MKKIISLLLTLVLALSLSVTAFAATATPDIDLTFDLSAQGSNDIVVKTGDIITVSYKLSASEKSTVSTTQNEIYYDHSFFELVAGSNKASAGFTDYTTTLQERLSGKRYVFFNTMTTHTHDTTPVEIGTFQLKVIATSGESTVANVNAFGTDTAAHHFGSDSQDLHVSIGSVQEQKFTVLFRNEDGSTYQSYTVKSGDEITLPAGPAKSGYTFSHWSIGGDSTKYLAGSRYEPKSNVSFTPNWVVNGNGGSTGGGGGSTLYTLTFETNGGSKIASISRSSGTVIQLESYVPTKDGRTFAGWFSDKALTKQVTSVKLTANTTVYAKWTKDGGFKDVPDGSYCDDAVDWAYKNGITKGLTDDMFGPNVPCTRAQIVTFLWRASGRPEATKRDCAFTDVNTNAYYYEALLWAIETGVTKGTTETTFTPDAICTRGQMVTFLYRYDGSPEVTGENPFSDVSSHAFYYTSVVWAVQKGITKGITATTFAPLADCTRGQIVTFLYRFMGQ